MMNETGATNEFVRLDPEKCTIVVKMDDMKAEYWDIYGAVKFFLEMEDVQFEMMEKNGTTPGLLAQLMDNPRYGKWGHIAELFNMYYGEKIIQLMEKKGYSRGAAAYAIRTLGSPGTEGGFEKFSESCAAWLNNMIRDRLVQSHTILEAATVIKYIIPEMLAEKYLDDAVIPWIKSEAEKN